MEWACSTYGGKERCTQGFGGEIWGKETNWKTLYIYIYIYIYTWVRALWIEFNNYPTRCDLFSLLHFCRQLYMFRVLTPIIRSWYSCNYSFWYWLTGSNTIRFRCWVGTDSCVSYCRYDTHESVPTVRYTWISTYRTIHMNQFQLNNESGW